MTQMIETLRHRPVLAWISEKIDGIQLRIERRRIYVRTRDELQALSNRELADLGISRGGIRGVALEAAHGAAH